MPREDIADGGDQRVDVPRTGQLGREGNVVDRAGPVQAVGEPAAQLRRRQRHRLVVCGCDQPGARLRQLARAQLVDPLRQQAHGGELEHVADAEFHTALRADRGDQLGGDQRVAAQIEERVVDAHPLVSEQPREQLGDPDFGGGRRVAVLGAGRQLRLRQRGAVDLLMGGDGDLVEHHVGGRGHIVRQRGGHPGADAFDVNGFRAGALGRSHVSHQALAQLRQVHGQDDGLPDTGVDRDGGGDLAQLDAEAADLHLLVGAADELDVAIGVTPGQVAGAVHPPARGERVGDKALGRQLRPAVVSVRDMCSGDVDLTDHPGRDGPQRVVEQVHLGVDLGPADRHYARALGAFHRVAGAVHDRLGRSVEVVQRRVEGGVELVGDLAGQGLPADGHPPQRAPLADTG